MLCRGQGHRSCPSRTRGRAVSLTVAVRHVTPSDRGGDPAWLRAGVRFCWRQVLASGGASPRQLDRSIPHGSGQDAQVGWRHARRTRAGRSLDRHSCFRASSWPRIRQPRSRYHHIARRSAAPPVPRLVMPSSFWVASTKRCKDAGSARSRSYGRDRGRGSAPRDRGPEADMYCWAGHLTRRALPLRSRAPGS